MKLTGEGGVDFLDVLGFFDLAGLSVILFFLTQIVCLSSNVILLDT